MNCCFKSVSNPVFANMTSVQSFFQISLCFWSWGELTHALVAVQDPSRLTVLTSVVLWTAALFTGMMAGYNKNRMKERSMNEWWRLRSSTVLQHLRPTTAFHFSQIPFLFRPLMRLTGAGRPCVIGALFSVVSVGTVLTQNAGVSRVTNTVSVSQTCAFTLTAAQTSTHPSRAGWTLCAHTHTHFSVDTMINTTHESMKCNVSVGVNRTHPVSVENMGKLISRFGESEQIWHYLSSCKAQILTLHSLGPIFSRDLFLWHFLQPTAVINSVNVVKLYITYNAALQRTVESSFRSNQFNDRVKVHSFETKLADKFVAWPQMSEWNHRERSLNVMIKR